MTVWPTQTDPLDRAILDLLCSLPATWRDHDKTGWTATEERALRLMEHAGLVERRDTLRATMAGRRETVEMVIVLSGNVTKPRVWKELFATVPEWLDGDDRTRGRVQLAVDAVQIRLTDQGELARGHYQNQTAEDPSVVCSFVRRQGFFAQRPMVKPVLRVESCRVETESTPDTGATAIDPRTADPVSARDEAIWRAFAEELFWLMRRMAAAVTTTGAAEEEAEDSGSEDAGPDPQRRWTQKEVIVAAKRYLRRNEFPGVRALARLIGCPPPTLAGALDADPELDGARNEFVGRRKPTDPSIRSGASGGAIEDIGDGSHPPELMEEKADGILQRLVEEWDPSERERAGAAVREHRDDLRKTLISAMEADDPDSYKAASDAVQGLIRQGVHERSRR